MRPLHAFACNGRMFLSVPDVIDLGRTKILDGFGLACGRENYMVIVPCPAQVSI